MSSTMPSQRAVSHQTSPWKNIRQCRLKTHCLTKTFPPRDNSGNVRRTRDTFHGGKIRSPSTRSPASGGASNNTFDTPSDAARRATFENTNSDKSVGLPLSREGRKVKNLTSQSITDTNRGVGGQGASPVDAHLPQSLFMTSGALQRAPAPRRGRKKVPNDSVHSFDVVNSRKSSKDLRTNYACFELGGQGSGKKRQVWASRELSRSASATPKDVVQSPPPRQFWSMKCRTLTKIPE